MVGGAYISGAASEIATKGLVNTVAPIGYNIGLAIGNKVFSNTYNQYCYMTDFFSNVIFLSNTMYILVLQIKTNFHSLSNSCICKYLSFSYALIYVHI